ncbi:MULTISPECIES: ArnT family glycosyltransferase [unclassified Candidatus Frackibacter]|uniref:ArnT family glycosyltransferase n=1 Tax=unclassified Candidatus Frackibacter TaxID=2648818 RepID=UPI0008826A6E|nr:MULTISPECIES: glycosyltransferase family 39 protein [unclassified Candidatus Frackibacter]SDC08336.1 Dolichyl-phosphate-mannose-protein mannosyltransferase [Candidatus Frackibacter sp. WG11]SEM38353.1 Dolichyl-phosphate-mannose-protein mannosyltransferase [Candidatus Frackibacter sp. WG12]SFL43952.1 Dolichyl-phosphate-mannose-protein mannosyltransferase [Candidatus Frackibacter sp. WG13]
MELSLSKRSLIYILLLVIFCGILYLPSTVNRDLHYRDELRYVEVAREMAAAGTWLVPHFGGEFYSDKPPFYFWVLNLSKSIFGRYSTLAMVLPSIMAAIIIVLLTSHFGKVILGEKYSLLPGLILATTLLFSGLAIFVRMDLLMAIFIIGALLSFYMGYQTKDDDRIKGRYYLLVYLLMGIATAIKGPAGFLVPLVVIPGFIILDGNLAEFKRLKLGKGLGVFLGVILLWLVPAVISGGKEYAYQLLVVQTFGRAVNSFAHNKPFYYYLMTLPATTFPWSPLLISSFIYFIKQRKEITTDVKFLLAWFWLPLILFSLFSGKLVFYLLPIYPAAALLVAYLCQKVIKGEANSKFLSIPVVLTICAFIAIGAAIPKSAEGIALRALMNPARISFMILGIFGLFLIFKKKYYWTPYLISLLVLIFIFNFSVAVVPLASKGYTKRPIANKLKQFREEKGVKNIVGFNYGEPESLAVYTGFLIHDINSKTKLVNYFQQRNEALAIMDQSAWQQVHKVLPMGAKKVYSSNDYTLIYYEGQDK